uniref:Conjugative transposon protein TraM n=1 Tax=Haemonchus contortus TaxID=6289 RepID=A0A7I5EEL2_HAECO
MALASFLINEGSTLANEIVSNLYVENIMMQAETPEEAIQNYTESKKLFEKIVMNLREYVSNSHEVNSRIPEIDKLQGTSMKILGVNYNTEQKFVLYRNEFPDDGGNNQKKT